MADFQQQQHAVVENLTAENSANLNLEVILGDAVETVEQATPEAQACAYVCGFIFKKLRNNDCENCRKQLDSADKSFRELRYFHKVAEKHINRDKLKEMRVKPAAQVFSHSVAVATEHLTARNLLPEECRQLIPITLLLDKLFDSLNSNTFHVPDGKIYKGCVKPSSPHHQLWEKAIKTLKTVKFTKKKKVGGKTQMVETSPPMPDIPIETIEFNNEVIRSVEECDGDSDQRNYECGWVLKKCLKSIVKTCRNCRSKIIEIKNNEDTLTRAREYAKGKQWFKSTTREPLRNEMNCMFLHGQEATNSAVTDRELLAELWHKRLGHINYRDLHNIWDSLDRKSYTGYAIKLGSNVINWKSRKQRSVALSSTEAECYAIADVSKDLCFIKQLLLELVPSLKVHIIVFNDNQSARKIIENKEISHKRTKHIDVRYHFIKDLVMKGFMTIFMYRKNVCRCTNKVFEF
ncbi:unnamed protein product [Euphydryas editha]|uniref:Transposable element P transposase-like GTP-binding insertion domain-containing protein n=1 Tax=Euphydryas editha TaxID=104508 RepID=A0AAU9TFI2_EUPED|nr:unnamed protein product [Euphydryas editha]